MHPYTSCQPPMHPANPYIPYWPQCPTPCWPLHSLPAPLCTPHTPYLPPNAPYTLLAPNAPTSILAPKPQHSLSVPQCTSDTPCQLTDTPDTPTPLLVQASSGQQWYYCSQHDVSSACEYYTYSSE